MSKLWPVLGVLAIVAIVFFGFFYNPAGNETVDPVDPEINANLRVNLNDLATRSFEEFSEILLEYSMPWMAEERVGLAGFSDAVSFPFASAQKDEEGNYDLSAMFHELEEEIMRNPVHGDMVMRGLRDIKLSTGKTIGELNPWLVEFIDKMDKAMLVPSASQEARGVEIWLTYKEGEEGKVFVTKEYREYAAMTCILLERLVKTGVEARDSSENWVLNYTAEGALTRTAKADYQENKAALILTYLRKNDTPEFTIGFNLLDKRLERFEPQKPKPTPTTPPAPAPTDPPPKPTDPPPTPTEPPEDDITIIVKDKPVTVQVTVGKTVRDAYPNARFAPDWNKPFTVTLKAADGQTQTVQVTHNTDATASFTFKDGKVRAITATESSPGGDYKYVSGNETKTAGSNLKVSFAFVNEYTYHEEYKPQPLTISVSKTVNDVSNSGDNFYADYNQTFGVDLYADGKYLTTVWPSHNSPASHTIADATGIKNITATERTPGGEYRYISGNATKIVGGSQVSFAFVNQYTYNPPAKTGQEPTPSGNGFQGEPDNPGNPAETTRPTQAPGNHMDGEASPGADSQCSVPAGTVVAPGANPIPETTQPPAVIIDGGTPTVTGDPGAP